MRSVFEMKEQWMYGSVPEPDLFIKQLFDIIDFQDNQLELAQNRAFALQKQIDRQIDTIECHRRSEK